MSGRGVSPDIPRCKREGLELDLEAVCAAGSADLTADDHYRLKTYGVCRQRHDGLFMIRLRVTAGVLDRVGVAAVTEAADRFAGGWVHLTTRQNIELHSVCLEDVPAIYDLLRPAGLVGHSACGHTIRNVIACPDAGTSIEEPFDVRPDASRISRMLVGKSRELNVALPGRLNITLGGCAQCFERALTNDIGLVAKVRDGIPGYQLWVGGGLGAAPRLSFLLRPFVGRDEVWSSVWSIVTWFCDNGDIDQVSRPRLKFLLEEKGEVAFREGFTQRFAKFVKEVQPPVPPIELASAPDLASSFAAPPSIGWRDGIEPERQRGYARITVRVPLGDLLASELREIFELAPSLAITPSQNLVVGSVPVAEVNGVVGELAGLGLGPFGAKSSADVIACPGLAFCPVAITSSQEVGLQIERALNLRTDLPRDFSIAVSGCPNSCARQQAADIGLAGGKTRLNGATRLSYQTYLGADLSEGLVGEPIMKLVDGEVPDAVVIVAELWVAFRRDGERPGTTFRRLGLDVVARAIKMRLREWGHDPAHCLATAMS